MADNAPWRNDPVAPAATPWAADPTAAAGAQIDLRRPAAVSDEAWYQQTYGRPAPLNSPNDDYMTMTQLSQLRQQQDPQGATAWQQELQRMVGTGQSLGPLSEGVTPGGDFTVPDTFGDRFRQAVYPFGDELVGVAEGVGGLFQGRPFSEGYNEGQQRERRRAEDYATAWPAEAGISRTVGTVGTMAGPAGVISAAARSAGLLTRSAIGAAGAGAAGFGYGAAETGGQPEEWARGGAAAMIPSMVVGGAASAVAPLVARGLSPFLLPRADDLPTNSQLRTTARQNYDAARDAGVVMDTAAGSPYEDFALRMMDRADEFGVDSVLTPSSARVVDLLAEAASKPRLEIRDLMNLRSRAALAARATGGSDAEFGRQMRDEIDDWLDGLTPADVMAGDPQAAAAALTQARASWSQLRRVETIETLETRAQLRAQAMNDPVGAVQAEFRALARNQREMARFTAEEQDAIRQIASGGGMGPLNLLSKFAPQNGFFAMLAAVQGAATGSPLLALSAGGAVARGLRRGTQQRQLGNLDSLIRGGGAQAPQGVGAATFAGQLGNLSLVPQNGPPLLQRGASALGSLIPIPAR